MKKTKKVLAIVLCALFGVAVGGQTSSALPPNQKTIMTSESILKALQNEDYIARISKTSTTPPITSTETILKSLHKGGYLKKANGRWQMADGFIHKDIQTPPYRALSQRFGGNLKLADTKTMYQQSISVMEPQNLSSAEDQRRVVALCKLLSMLPNLGSNTVIITHRPSKAQAMK